MQYSDRHIDIVGSLIYFARYYIKVSSKLRDEDGFIMFTKN